MRKRLGLAPAVAMAVNFVLFFIKLYIGLRTNCLCIYTDSVNNLADTLSALLALFGIYLISRPASERYPHGKGRGEYVLGFLMAVLVSGAGLLFAYNSLERFFAPTPVWFFVKYAVILAATGAVKLILGFVFLHLNKKDRSPITHALMLDSFTDFGITAVALTSFTLTNYTEFIIDAYLGLFISIVTVIVGVRLTKNYLNLILGARDDALCEKICETVKYIDNSIEIISLSVHNYGVEKNEVTLSLRGNRNKQGELKAALLSDLNLESTVEWEENYE